MFSLSFIRVFLPVDEHHLPLLEGSTSEFWVGRAPTAPLRQQLRAAATQNQAPASPPKMQPPKKKPRSRSLLLPKAYIPCGSTKVCFLNGFDPIQGQGDFPRCQSFPPASRWHRLLQVTTSWSLLCRGTTKQVGDFALKSF